MTNFEGDYYRDQGLETDRIALWYYARVIRRLCDPGARVLEFGCGTGHLLKRLSHDFEAIGYDVSSKARSACRENAPDAIVLEEWQSIDDASLSAIVTLHTLEHVDRPGPVLSSLAAKLKPGGLFLAVVPNTASPGRRLKGDQWFGLRDPTHCSLLSQGEWVTVVRRAGLQTLWVRGDGMWDAPYVSMLPTSLQQLVFGLPAGLQVFSPIARPMLPPTWGECLIIAAEKRPSTDQ